MATQPQIIVMAGPNGAGKSTAAARLLPENFPFVNADEVAKTLPSYPSRGADLEAGRLALLELDRLEQAGESFAVETTLAGRTLAARIGRLRDKGYRFRLVFLFLPSADLAIERVAGRVRLGGHNIPEATIRRRFEAGIQNFFSVYLPLADRWAAYDTTRGGRPRLIAAGRRGVAHRVREPALWQIMQERRSDV